MFILSQGAWCGAALQHHDIERPGRLQAKDLLKTGWRISHGLLAAVADVAEKVDKTLLPKHTNEKTNVKLKEKEESRVQGGDLEKNDNINDHGDGVDEDGEPDECLARDSEKRAAEALPKALNSFWLDH
ncbi:hypothetical protein NDU88_002118 [Pleurodeles waltl]|uniref:Uncharacterized protein n=1 Tax=Pleurodeles waltl TaxID=8319 RepID=A0AAV7UYY0_PLEWA|nr:hypothetical protein NDU88_002118 [Pleurodeles waltl]